MRKLPIGLVQLLYAPNMRLYTEFVSKEAGLLRVTGTINLPNII